MSIPPDYLKEVDNTLKASAKSMAYGCFRNNNNVLEDLHAQGKITQDEMKAMSIAVTDNLYSYLKLGTEGINMLRIPLFAPPDYWAEPTGRIYELLRRR